MLQFHLSPGHAAESVSSLGAAGEAAHWHQGWAVSPLLHPGTSRAPALRMDLQDGTPCPPPPEEEEQRQQQQHGGEGADGADTPSRRSTLLALCSPDGRLRVAVRELERCVYTIELYVPALCSALPTGRWDGAADGDDPVLDPGLSVVEQEELELGTIQLEQEGLEALLEDGDAVIIIDEL